MSKTKGVFKMTHLVTNSLYGYPMDSYLGAASAMIGVTTFLVILAILIGIAFLAAFYILYCFPQMVIGRKTRSGSDWMAFVPVARSIQKTKIADMPLWKFPFLGWASPLIGYFLFSLIMTPLVMAAPGFSIITALGGIAIMVMSFIFNYQYNYRLCKIFDFHPFLAFAMLFVPLNSTIFTFLIVYSNRFDADKNNLYGGNGTFGRDNGFLGMNTSYDKNEQPYTPPANPNPVQPNPVQPNPVQSNPVQPAQKEEFKPGLICKSGIHAGNRFEFKPYENIIFGSDSSRCSIVFDASSPKISPLHCSISYSPAIGGYIVTDMSMEGTYINGARINANAPFKAVSGSVIALGDDSNSFVLV